MKVNGHAALAELLAEDITGNILPDPVTTADILDICAIYGILLTQDTTGAAGVAYTEALYGDFISVPASETTSKEALLAEQGAG